MNNLKIKNFKKDLAELSVYIEIDTEEVNSPLKFVSFIQRQMNVVHHVVIDRAKHNDRLNSDDLLVLYQVENENSHSFLKCDHSTLLSSSMKKLIRSYPKVRKSEVIYLWYGLNNPLYKEK
jgi:hypothetical protein